MGPRKADHAKIVTEMPAAQTVESFPHNGTETSWKTNAILNTETISP